MAAVCAIDVVSATDAAKTMLQGENRPLLKKSKQLLYISYKTVKLVASNTTMSAPERKGGGFRWCLSQNSSQHIRHVHGTFTSRLVASI